MFNKNNRYVTRGGKWGSRYKITTYNVEHDW